MIRPNRGSIRRRSVAAALLGAGLAAAACSSPAAPTPAVRTPSPSHHSSATAAPSTLVPSTPASSVSATATRPAGSVRPAGEVTINFAGDVHFMNQVGARLAANPATVFGEAEPVLADADLTMVNLETAITTGGDQQNKEFTFRAPPSAFTALRDAGVDVATMANNHGADYGASGLADTFAAIVASHFPVVGIGPNAARAYAPYTTTINGVRIAIFAASQVQDETLANFTAGPSSPGIASAFNPQLLANVSAAHAAGYVTIVYVHWGTEYVTCPNADQRTLATQLADAGASAVIGTHAHVLQGAGWAPNGTFVAYGLGNYLWWRTFGNDQDDNGVLTITVRGGKVVADVFHPSHLDDRGVPVPSTGAQAQRIDAEWAGDRACTNLSATPPA